MSCLILKFVILVVQDLIKNVFKDDTENCSQYIVIKVDYLILPVENVCVSDWFPCHYQNKICVVISESL